MTPNENIQVILERVDPVNILVKAPELGEKCGVVTGNPVVAELFEKMVTGVLSGEQFFNALMNAFGPDAEGPAKAILQACGQMAGFGI